MNRYLPSFMATFAGVALLAMSVVSLPEPAAAQFGGFGIPALRRRPLRRRWWLSGRLSPLRQRPALGR